MASEFLVTPARAADPDNDTYSGAIWYFYASGTTTPLAVYSDPGLTVSLGSTVTADSGGKFPNIYLNQAQTYRGILTNADGSDTIFDIPVLNPFASALGEINQAIDELAEQVAEDIAAVEAEMADLESNLPTSVIETFDNISASDAAQMRRAMMAASVEALKNNALNLNGNCRVSQWNGANAVSDIGENDADGEEVWVIDGHKVAAKGTLRVAASQVAVTDLPGFTHAFRIAVQTAQPAIGTSYLKHVTVCESSRFAPLAWGTLKARDIIRYMWVKTSMAGTYTVFVFNGNFTFVSSPSTFTVDEPNSWQLVCVRIPAQTAPSSWDMNLVGGRCEILLAGAGQANLAAEVGHYFMLTGLLDLPGDYDTGLQDTALLMPAQEDNLRACQRFYQKSYNMSTIPGATVQFNGSLSQIAAASVSFLTAANVRFPISMVTNPVVEVYSPQTGAAGRAYNSNTTADVVLSTQLAGTNGFHAYVNGVAVTAGHGLSFHYTADARIG